MTRLAEAKRVGPSEGMTEQEAIKFIFEILQRILIYHEELTDDQREILDYYLYYLNDFYKREEE